VPATIVNWAGDEVVSVQQWCAYAGELARVRAAVEVGPSCDGPAGAIADSTLRLEITGPCRIGWHEGMRRTMETRHPEVARPA
jgi:hypothetical protein